MRTSSHFSAFSDAVLDAAVLASVIMWYVFGQFFSSSVLVCDSSSSCFTLAIMACLSFSILVMPASLKQT